MLFRAGSNRLYDGSMQLTLLVLESILGLDDFTIYNWQYANDRYEVEALNTLDKVREGLILK